MCGRWQVHVARPIKDLAMRARAATWQLTQELGRMPAESDLAASLGVSGRDLRNAQLAEMAFQPSSLDASTSGQPGAAMSADLLGGEDPRMEYVLDMHMNGVLQVRRAHRPEARRSGQEERQLTQAPGRTG
jgi:RNA polymerase sigma-B factor